MAERMTKHRQRGLLSRSASAESSDPDQVVKPIKHKLKKPKERWLLTRKTWRYMADAGRKLIPEGAQNRPEDLQEIESHFQQICKKEPKFLLWRKNSYPGALSFRKRRRKIPGGSCRKANSADEVDVLKAERPKDLPLYTSGGRFDIQKMKYDFLNAPAPSPRSFLKDKETFPRLSEKQTEEDELIGILEKFLATTSEESLEKTDFDYQELVDRLQKHLSISNIPSRPLTSRETVHRRRENVHFEGDHVQRSLHDTLSRYFSQSPSRDKIISDLLTNRKALQKLYFDLRQTRGFRGHRDYPTSKPSANWDQSMLRHYKSKLDMSDYKKQVPPPLIEIQGESLEPTFADYGTQTTVISESELLRIEEEYKKNLAEQAQEELDSKPNRRRSSVDHDDVSQSVSDHIKRYLRMARKKSADSDKADRFKRVNYDRNLRNIKAKGEITKPGDDDGLNKGCQTADDWILSYRELKFDETLPSGQSSARSSFDAGVLLSSTPTSPTKTSFLSSLLHKHDKSNEKSTAGPTMQKSKSSSSVVHHGGRLMAKTIFKRSKSQSRGQAVQPCTWTPKGSCVWNNVNGKQVVLGETTLQQLSEIEHKVLQKVALAKLQALNLGVSVKIPSETAVPVVTKKRRPYLLKRKALTTGIFDTGRKDEKDKQVAGTGLVFGIPLSQCVENDRTSRLNAGGTFVATETGNSIPRTSSRASFSSLMDAPIRVDEKDSGEGLSRDNRMVGSVPGLLDSLSCSSTADITGSTQTEEETAVPHVISECIRHLEAHGLHTLGIFRVSPSKKRVRQLRENFDSGRESVLSSDQCPHDVATLLKEFLRDLPDPLLCRDLYNAFVQTQKIRNRRLQMEALQHLVQLLPSANRDTLSVLLDFLANVAKYSNDQTNPLGETVIGNKMNSTNLATVFAPNILHSLKQGKEAVDRPDDRIDVINVIRTMIDSNRTIFVVSAELLDEIYVHMMDTHPEALEELLNKRESTFEDVCFLFLRSQDEISDGSLWSPVQPGEFIEDAFKLQDEGAESKPRKTYSREECLHESAATGGPNVAMRIRHKERCLRERTARRRHEESATRGGRRDDDSGSSTSSINRIRDSQMYAKTRSSSLESNSSLPATDSGRADITTRVLRVTGSETAGDSTDRRKSTPYTLDKSGIITASLTIPVQSSVNINEDIPYIEEAPNAPPRRRQRSIGSGSDSSVASIVQPVTGSISLIGYDSAVGSSLTHSSPPHNTTPSSVGSSIDASGLCSSPPSWASTPPTSPDSQNTTVNYIPDDIQPPSGQFFGGGGGRKTGRQREPILQKVSYTSTSELHKATKSKIDPRKKSVDIQKCQSSPVCGSGVEGQRAERFNPSITSIGNAVLRSRTADFERITKTSALETKGITPSDKKKYTKRRYMDLRHQTRHIPDVEALEQTPQTTRVVSGGGAQTIYKRRELISSAPTGS